MDSIDVHGIECWTHIGVTDAERKHAQQVQITVKLWTDTKAAAKSDDISKTIDYAEVAEHIVELAKKERKTIEAFAHDIAEDILKAFKPDRVKVCVWKRPLPTMTSVCLTIERP